MKIKTYKIFSLSDTFGDLENLYDAICDITDRDATDVYLRYELIQTSKKTPNSVWDDINDILIREGAVLDEHVLIEIDHYKR